MAAIPETSPRWAPAFLSLGFRPFFLFGALFAVVLMALWVPWFLGLIAVPSALPPVAWHTHEILLGLVPAIVAGTLLTAVPASTGRRPITGWPLTGLVLLWLAGRLAMAGSAHLDAGWTAVLSVAFPLVLAAVVGREIVAAGDRRHLVIVAALVGLAAADLLFHWEIWQFGRTKLAHGLALALVMILLIAVAGHIVPTLTANWLHQNRPGAPLPTVFGRFDAATLVVSGAALLGWVLLPLFADVPWTRPMSGALLLAAGAANLVRQARWHPHRTLAEPLLAILHVAYLFVGFGFVLLGLGVLRDNDELAAAGLNAWTSGAIATLMLAVMTRLAREHTGRPLTAPLTALAGAVLIYAAILVAAGARIGAGLYPERTPILLPLAGLAWIAAFGGFAVLYGPMLLTRCKDGGRETSTLASRPS